MSVQAISEIAPLVPASGWGEISSSRVLRDQIAAALDAIIPIERVVYATIRERPPELAYQVPFPRLGLVLSGETDHILGAEGDGTFVAHQKAGTALFVAADAWNDPQWGAKEVITLDLLFGKQRLGFSLAHWNGHEQESLAKYDVPRRGPRTGTLILQALGELAWRPEDVITPAHLVRALIAHAQDLLSPPAPAATRSAAFLQAIRDYVDEHYQHKLTRESVAAEFEITPNYMSHLFQRGARLSFNEYLTTVRMEHAKYLLRGYEISIKEVSTRCGFTDSNYFCRLFRQKTGRSPSDYRVDYHSHAERV